MEIEEILRAHEDGVLHAYEAKDLCLDQVAERGVEAVLCKLPPEWHEDVIDAGLNAFFHYEAGVQTFSIVAGDAESYGLCRSYKTYSCPEGVAVRNWVEQHWEPKRLAALDRESAIYGVAQVPPLTASLVDALVAALDDSSRRVRKRAVEALATMEKPPETVIGKLLAIFLEADRPPSRLYPFWENLGPSAEPFVPQLRQLLKRSKAWGALPVEAACALGRIGPAARAALADLLEMAQELKDKLPWADILSSIGCILGGDAIHHEAFMGLARDAVDGAFRRFRSESPPGWSSKNGMLRALRLVKRLPEEVATAILGGANVEARVEEFLHAAGQADLYDLADLGPAVVPKLLEAFSDWGHLRRQEAARGLGRIGREASLAIPFLLQALNDENQSVRINAAEALWRIGIGPEYAAAVLAFTRDYNPTVRAWACLIVAETGVCFVDVCGDLIDRLGDYYPAARIAAAEAIRRFRRDALPMGPELVESFVRQAFVVYPLDEESGKTAGLDEDADEPLLEAFREHPDQRVRRSFATFYSTVNL